MTTSTTLGTLFVTALLATAAPGSALAAAAPGTAQAVDDARAFMDKVFNRGTWDDMQGGVELTITNKQGKTKKREIKMWSRSNAKDETSMLMRFVKPADVRGTGFLMIEHQGGEDDRRMYLPALRRVNRISASGSGGNFMSSDFTYYDVGMPKLEDWSFSFGADKTVAGVACKTVIGTAATKKVTDDTGYAKVIWYIDPTRLIGLASDYYEKGDRKLKTMEVLKIEEISGVPFGTHMKMSDAHTGHVSEMRFVELKTNTGVEDKVFSERNLRKWTR